MKVWANFHGNPSNSCYRYLILEQSGGLTDVPTMLSPSFLENSNNGFTSHSLFWWFSCFSLSQMLKKSTVIIKEASFTQPVSWRPDFVNIINIFIVECRYCKMIGGNFSFFVSLPDQTLTFPHCPTFLVLSSSHHLTAHLPLIPLISFPSIYSSHRLSVPCQIVWCVCVCVYCCLFLDTFSCLQPLASCLLLCYPVWTSCW